MRGRAWLVVLALLALCVAPALADSGVPTLPHSQVTVPWEEFAKIIELLRTKPPVEQPDPPQPWGLGVARVRGALVGEVLEARIDLELSVFSDEWVSVPVLPANAPLIQARLDGRPAPLARQSDGLALVLYGRGTHQLSLLMRAAAPQRPGPNNALLPLVPRIGAEVEIDLPQRLTDVTIEGAVGTRVADGTYLAVLPEGRRLVLRYTVPLEGELAQPEQKLPPKVVADVQTLLTLDEGLVRADAWVHYNVRHSPVSNFSLELPAGFEVATVEGEGIAGWKVLEVDGATILEAQVGFEVEGDYLLKLRLERSTESSNFDVRTPLVHARSVERESGVLAVQAQGGVEVTPGEIGEALPVDPKELPPQLVARAQNPILFGYRYVRPPQISLNVVRHESAPVLEAAVDNANLVCQVTDDGKSVTRAQYWVRNNRKQFLEVLLPQGSVLWSAFVDGNPVKPSIASRGTEQDEARLLVPLKKSEPGEGELRPFEVELIYFTPIDQMDAIGSLELLTPVLELPISMMAITAYLPQRFDYLHVGGSMDPPLQPVVSHGPLGLLSRFGVGRNKMLSAPASDELKVSAPSQDQTEMLMYRQSMAELDNRQRVAEEEFSGEVARKVTTSSGSLPARFSLPQAGQPLRRIKVLVMQDAPTVKLIYAGAFGAWVLKLLAMVAGLQLALRAIGHARRRLDREHGTMRNNALSALWLALALGLPAGLEIGWGWVVFGIVIGIAVAVFKLRRQRGKASA
ncbi:MAG: hypothetical protein P9M14_18665 [Candidatus Alcyoniella australis]|nr:hypothetical protein [Candidatus Alcyoniella australis]